MVTTMQKRVARLEESAGVGKCPECGWGGGDNDNRPCELRWIDPGGPDDREEYCEECGRQLVYVLTWGDEAS